MAFIWTVLSTWSLKFCKKRLHIYCHHSTDLLGARASAHPLAIRFPQATNLGCDKTPWRHLLSSTSSRLYSLESLCSICSRKCDNFLSGFDREIVTLIFLEGLGSVELALPLAADCLGLHYRHVQSTSFSQFKKKTLCSTKLCVKKDRRASNLYRVLPIPVCCLFKLLISCLLTVALGNAIKGLG